MIKRNAWKRGVSRWLVAFLVTSMLSSEVSAAEVLPVYDGESNIEVTIMDEKEPEAEEVIGDEQEPEAEEVIGDEQEPEAEEIIGDEQEPEAEEVIGEEQEPETEVIIDDESDPKIEEEFTDQPAEFIPGIPVDEGCFPDDSFREYVSATFDLDKNNVLTDDEILEAKYVDVKDMRIYSLKGIEYFTELIGLDCDHNYLIELNLTANTKLTYLHCEENQLRKLNITNLAGLVRLHCIKNAIKSLDLSTNTNLDKLDLGYNQLTALDLTNNSKLTLLRCNDNFIAQMTFPKNSKLEYIYAYDNQLTSLKVNISTLKYLDVDRNKLTSLDVSACSNLGNLCCDNNQLSSLNISGLPVYYLRCENNRIKKLDLTNCTALKDVGVDRNCLTQLDANTCKKLETLSCQFNPLTTLRVDQCSKLNNLYLSDTQLPYIKVHKDAPVTDTFYKDPGIYFTTGTRNQSGYLQCDLSKIEGFDASKVYNLSGGKIEGNTLVVDDKEVTYNYRSGNGHFTEEKYRIRVSEHNENYYLQGGVLCIKYKGAMPDFADEDGKRAPWYDLRDKVESVQFVGSATTDIGAYAFYGMYKLKWIYDDTNIRTIGDYAFADSLVWYFSASQGLTSIGKSAFKNCSKLSYVRLYSARCLDTIGADAFKGCSLLTEVRTYDNAYNPLHEWCQINFENVYSNPLAANSKVKLIASFGEEEAVTDIEIPLWVGEINAYTFANYTYLKSVTFTPGIRKIGSKAFNNCSSLKNVYFLGNAPTVSSSAFNGVTAKVGYSPTFWSEDKRLDYGGTLSWSNIDKITFTSQPENVNADDNQKVTFSVGATGYHLSYQWQYSTNQGKTWKNVTSASGTTPNYSFTTKDTQNGRLQRCKVQTLFGTTKYSNVAVLTLGAPIKITAQPLATTAIEGDKVIFGITATGDTLSYQWQYSKDGGTSWTTPTTNSSKTAKYSVTASKSNNGMKVRCQLTDRFGKTATSKTVTLTVRLLAKITSQPKDAAGKVGEKATFAVKASGEVNGYQWYYSDDGGKTWSMSKAESATTATYTYTIKNTHNGRLARCVVKGPDGRDVTSNAAKLTLLPDIVISTQPANKSVTEDQSVSFSVAATGDELTYQWQQSTDQGKSWSNITGATATKYSFTAKQKMNGYQYRCRITDKYSYVKNSNAAVLTVKAAIQITTQPKAVTATEGTNATFKIVATGTGLTYQWQYSQDNGTTWKDSGAASGVTATYVLGAKISRNGYLIRCTVKDASGNTKISDAVKLTVTPAGPVITTQPQAVTAVEGTNATFKVVATGTGLTYQWQYSQDNGTTWKNSGAASGVTNTYVLGAKVSRNGYLIRCVVKDANGNSAISNAVKLTVTSAGPVITTQPQAVTAVEGTNATFKVVATGTGLTYQWQYSQDNGTTWRNSGAVSSVTDTYVLGAKASRNGYLIRCIVTDANGKTVTSSEVRLTVKN